MVQYTFSVSDISYIYPCLLPYASIPVWLDLILIQSPKRPLFLIQQEKSTKMM